MATKDKVENEIKEKDVADYLLRVLNSPGGPTIPSSQVELMTVAKQWLNQVKARK